MGKVKIEHGLLVSVIGFIILTIISAIFKQYAYTIFCAISLAICFLCYFLTNIIATNNAKKQKEISKVYKDLKQKNSTNLFEKCYMLSVKEELDDILSEKIKEMKIKEVGGFYSDVMDKNTVHFGYRYRGFDVTIIIKEDKISYKIDTPKRYDGSTYNETFEKEKTTDISLKECVDLEMLVDQLISLIERIKLTVCEFINNTNVDNLFNGRHFEKVVTMKSYLKSEGIIGLIFSPILIIIMAICFYFCLNDTAYKNENLAGYILALIFIPLFIGLGVYGLISGIKSLIKVKDINDDIKFKRFSVINEKVKKVKVNVFRVRHSSMYARYIYLYFETVKLCIPLPNAPFISTLAYEKYFVKECKKIKHKITYLNNSKVVINGEKEFIKLFFKYYRYDL